MDSIKSNIERNLIKDETEELKNQSHQGKMSQVEVSMPGLRD